MRVRAFYLRMALLAAAFGFLLWGFRELLFFQIPFLFRDPNEELSYGWYVPLFSLYVLWKERKELVTSLGEPDGWALVLMLPLFFLGFIGVRGLQVRFSIVSFVGLLFALPWAVFGRATARRILFPCLFLLFCLPLANFLDVFTVHLRLLATSTATTFLQGVGVDIVRRGTAIYAGDGSFAIDIAAPCSGLRSIFALMALTAGYAYFNQPTWLRRALLFALSVPLAVLGNVMRVITICLVGSLASADFATGFYHDYSGYIVFIVAIALMVLSGEVISWIWKRWGHADAVRTPRLQGDAVRTPRLRGSVVLWPILAVALVAVAMCFQGATPKTTLAEPPVVALADLAGYTVSNMPPAEAELKVLPADTRIEKRLYQEMSGHWYLVTLVVGGSEKGSIHRPELCLPSQGYLMTQPHSIDVQGAPWRHLTLAANTAGGHDLGFAYTFLNQEGFRTSSHVRRILRDVWDRSFLARIDRWAMVTVVSSRADERALARFLVHLEEGLR